MKPATPKPTRTRKPHVAIIGSGLAGLSAALWAAQTQARVTLLTKGIGGLLLSNGTIDILGFQTSPDGSETLAENPVDGLEHLPKTHPYRVIGTENLLRGLDAFLAETDCLRVPAPNRNVFSPSPAGSARPTYALPHTGLVLKDGMKLLVVGLEQFKDFPAQLIADNLARSEHVRLQARAMLVDLPGRGQEADVNATDYARSFDSPRGAEMQRRLAQAINAQVLPGEVGPGGLAFQHFQRVRGPGRGSRLRGPHRAAQYLGTATVRPPVRETARGAGRYSPELRS